MKQWDRGQQVIFEANPDYYGKAPKMKKVTVLFLWKRMRHLRQCSPVRWILPIRRRPIQNQAVPGYKLLSFETVDNRGFNLPAVARGGAMAPKSWK